MAKRHRARKRKKALTPLRAIGYATLAFGGTAVAELAIAPSLSKSCDQSPSPDMCKLSLAIPMLALPFVASWLTLVVSGLTIAGQQMKRRYL